MPHSYIANWLHIIWSTKNRDRSIFKESAIKIRQHFLEKAEENNAPIETINIQPEHVHILLNLPATKSLDSVVHQLKGESSHWINDEKILTGHFHWQKGYGAFSVAASMLEQVKEYIRNQEEHHRRKTFAEEFAEFLEKYGFEVNSDF